ncbi:MAG: peptide/nickel transport system substrate-binding protein [Actinomycetota bacterium]|nr:peptide/nickel transport system substrate-binding protein [Actinomycetota bacterium]
MRRSTGVRLVALSGILALGATACGGSSTGGTKSNGSGNGGSKAAAQTFSIDNNAKGPAYDVPGHTTGGVIHDLEDSDFSHLDPARIYVNNNQVLAEVVERQLNAYIQKDGKITLVGDLATNTGVTKDGGKTWTFTLRDGVKYDDGNPIKPSDIKYAVERGFDAAYTEGPTYLYEWLAGKKGDFRKFYEGPYKGKELPDTVIKADDAAKTITFFFDQPRPDMPFASALTTTSPVQKAKDTKEKYDLNPQATGPYKISEHHVDKSLTLVKNTQWDPNTDPARHQYADSYVFEFGTDALGINKRLIAANGNDAAALSIIDTVVPEVLKQVDTTPEIKARTLTDLNSFVLVTNINNTRIKDVEIRKALLYAYPLFQTRQILGGASYGDFASTVLSPTLPGYQSYDLYDQLKFPQGQPDKAKAILTAKGKVGMPIVYGYSNTPTGQQAAVAVKAAYEKAGFKLIAKPIDRKTFYDVIGKVNNQFDMYGGGWGADWPSASTVIPPTLDGRKIADGSPNYEHFNDPEVNAEMDRIMLETDLVQAGKDWAALDKKIMEKVPYIPRYYNRTTQVIGPKIGGAYLSKIYGAPSLNGLYLKK